LPGLGEIWNKRLSSDALNSRIENIHRPYHAVLSKVMEEMRDRWGAATLVDLHSMPPLRPVNAKDKPAEFVIGDRFGSSCHELLSDTALRSLGGAGKRVAHNRPYSGGYVLDHHSAPRRNVFALQIEICRSLYLDGQMEEMSSRAERVVTILSDLVRELGADTLSLAGPMQQAAE
jgi:N-formylglutamate amidohydrolase